MVANPNIIHHFETSKYMITPVNDDPPHIEIFEKADLNTIFVLQIQGEEIYNFFDAFEMAVREVEKMQDGQEKIDDAG